MKIQLLNGARPSPRIGGRTRTRLLLALTLLLTGCASSVSAAWPKPAIAYTHAATHQQAIERVLAWCGKPGQFQNNSQGVSMRPYLHGGPREYHLQETYTGRKFTKADRGLVVTFDRGDVANVQHMIADVSANGDWLYLSGANNRWSDGWFHRSKVKSILREVITLPALNPSSSVSQ